MRKAPEIGSTLHRTGHGPYSDATE